MLLPVFGFALRFFVCVISAVERGGLGVACWCFELCYGLLIGGFWVGV